MRLSTGLVLALGCACQPTFAEGFEVGADTGEGIGHEGEDGPSSSHQLYINEFMASNRSLLFEGMPEDYTPDWIELFNASDDPLDLEGFTITDDLTEPDRHTFVKLVIEPQGYVVLYADGSPEDGPQHIDFKLDMDGESIGLYSAQGTPLDRVEYTDMMSDLSAARIPDGGGLVGTYESTPGQANPTEIPD